MQVLTLLAHLLLAPAQAVGTRHAQAVQADADVAAITMDDRDQGVGDGLVLGVDPFAAIRGDRLEAVIADAQPLLAVPDDLVERAFLTLEAVAPFRAIVGPLHVAAV